MKTIKCLVFWIREIVLGPIVFIVAIKVFCEMGWLAGEKICARKAKEMNADVLQANTVVKRIVERIWLWGIIAALAYTVWF